MVPRLITILFILGSVVSYGQWNLEGDASNLGGDCFRITPELNSQEGAVWKDSVIDLSDDFDLRFSINLGDKDGTGADGMSFVLQQDNDGLGIGGGSLGYEGLNNSLAIEFDTYQNGIFGDPTYDHIAMLSNGSVYHTAGTALTGVAYIIAGTANAEDGDYHDVQVVWDAASTTISVYVDCVFRLSYTGDIVEDIFDGNPEVYLGFTGATGGLNNDQRVCYEGFIYPEPIAPIPDETICFGDSIQVFAPAGFAEYDWSPTGGVSDPDVANPYLFPPDTMTYIMTAEGYCGELYKDTIIVNVIPDNSFFTYPADSFCVEGNVIPDFVDDPGGDFSVTPSGLELDISTGEIDLGNSDEGMYTVTYEPPFNSCPFSSTAEITVLDFPDASFAYDDTLYCPVGSTTPSATLVGGTYASDVAGLSLDPVSGELDLTDTSPGDTITIYYTIDGFCPSTDSFTLVIRDFDEVFLSYDTTHYCPSGTVLPDSVVVDGGSFSVFPGDLSVDPVTGEIDLATGEEGEDYTITYLTSPDACGSEISFSLTIDFLDDPGFGYSGSSFCATGTLDPDFINTPGGTFTVDPPSLSIDFLSGTIDLETGTVGESYTITYSTPEGPCQDESSVVITIDPNDDSTFTYPFDSYCPFGTVLPDLIVTPGGTFTISPDTGLPVDDVSGMLTLEGATAGFYTITYTTPEGLCSSSSSVVVEIDTVVDAYFTYTDTGFCRVGTAIPDILNPGGLFALVAGVSIDAGTGEIDLGACTPGGPYPVYYTSSGCASTDTFYVTIYPDPEPTISFDSPVCIESGPVSLTGLPEGGAFSGTGVAGDLFQPTGTPGAGFYPITYTYTDGNGCTAAVTNNIQVVVHAVDAGPDQSIVEGTSAQLEAIGGSVFTWTPSSGLSCTGCASPLAQPLESTNYTVTSYNDLGCLATDMVSITLVPFNDLTIFVPNTFTPNGDGKNDRLVAYGSDIEIIEFFEIYDRWGNMIWRRENLLPGVEAEGWDGYGRGREMDPGVYIYRLQVMFTYGVPGTATGNVTLLR